MGLVFSILAILGEAGPGPIDEGPSGRPYNTYWRARQKEAAWILREALLDGDADTVFRLFGISPEHSLRARTDALQEQDSPSGSSGKSSGSSDKSIFAWMWRCFVCKADDEDQHDSREVVQTSGDVSRAVLPNMPALPKGFELRTAVWDDDNFYTALHYLAQGRCNSLYSGARTHFPLIDEDGAKEDGISAILSESARVVLLKALVEQGVLPIGRGLLSAANRFGSTPLHVCAASGGLEIMKALVALDEAHNMPDLAFSSSSALSHDADSGVYLSRVSPGPRMAASLLSNPSLTREHSSSIFVLRENSSVPVFAPEAPSNRTGAVPTASLPDSESMRPVDVALALGFVECAAAVGFEFLSTLPEARGRFAAVMAGGFEPVPEGGASYGMQGPEVLVHATDEERMQQVKLRVQRLQELIHVDAASASALLYKYAYDEAAAAKNYLSDGDMRAPEQISGGLADAGDVSICVEGGDDDRMCPICMEGMAPDKLTRNVCGCFMSCGHLHCDDCMVSYARARLLDEGDVALLVCPAVGCSVPIPADAIKELSKLPGGEGLAHRYTQLSAQFFVNAAADVRWCPAPGCGRSVELPASAIAKASAVTCDCGVSFCFNCRCSPAHEPASCKDWHDFSTSRNTDQEWMLEHTTPCTGCEAPVERSQGCNHMRCTVCNGEFCFACGARWNNAHYGCARRPRSADDEGPGNGWSLKESEVRRKAVCVRRHGELMEVGASRTGTYWITLGERSGLHEFFLLAIAQDALNRGARVLAHAYVIDWALPSGLLSPQFLQARKQLQTLRDALEKDFESLATLLAVRQGQGAADVRDQLALACVVREGGAPRRTLEGLTQSVEAKVDRLLHAGRVGALSKPTKGGETVSVLLGEVFSTGKSAVRRVQEHTRLLGIGMWDFVTQRWAQSLRQVGSRDSPSV